MAAGRWRTERCLGGVSPSPLLLLLPPKPDEKPDSRPEEPAESRPVESREGLGELLRLTRGLSEQAPSSEGLAVLLAERPHFSPPVSHWLPL